MRRSVVVIVVSASAFALLAGVGLALMAPPQPDGRVPLGLSVFVGLVVVLVALWKRVAGTGKRDTAPPPWTDEGALVEETPESTPATDRISGTALTDRIEDAAEQARAEHDLEAGLEVLREPLREALIEALQRGNRDRAAVEQTLATGDWTDDQVAAAVLDEAVHPPSQPLRRRLWVWAFPEKAVRHRTARAVGAIAQTADTSLPTVVGQDAPRTVPVTTPRLETLERAADGSLQPAVEGSGEMSDVGPEASRSTDVDTEAEPTETASADPERDDLTPVGWEDES